MIGHGPSFGSDLTCITSRSKNLPIKTKGRHFEFLEKIGFSAAILKFLKFSKNRAGNLIFSLEGMFSPKIKSLGFWLGLGLGLGLQIHYNGYLKQLEYNFSRKPYTHKPNFLCEY